MPKEIAVPELAEEGRLGGYSELERQNWALSKRIVIYESEAQLCEFIWNAINGAVSDKKMYFGKILKVLAERIRRYTGIDVEGYNIAISENEIRKIFKDHGSEATETPRGHRAITEDDIVSIPVIIKSPDKILLDSKPYGGKPVIKFIITITGRTTIVSYVSDKHSDLRVQTMYSGKRSGTLAPPTNAKAPVRTP
jgi:hypothetical protein